MAVNLVSSVMVEFVYLVNKDYIVILKIFFIDQAAHSTVPTCTFYVNLIASSSVFFSFSFSCWYGKPSVTASLLGSDTKSFPIFL